MAARGAPAAGHPHKVQGSSTHSSSSTSSQLLQAWLLLTQMETALFVPSQHFHMLLRTTMAITEHEQWQEEDSSQEWLHVPRISPNTLLPSSRELKRRHDTFGKEISTAKSVRKTGEALTPLLWCSCGLGLQQGKNCKLPSLLARLHAPICTFQYLFNFQNEISRLFKFSIKPTHTVSFLHSLNAGSLALP